MPIRYTPIIVAWSGNDVASAAERLTEQRGSGQGGESPGEVHWPNVSGSLRATPALFRCGSLPGRPVLHRVVPHDGAHPFPISFRARRRGVAENKPFSPRTE